MPKRIPIADSAPAAAKPISVLVNCPARSFIALTKLDATSAGLPDAIAPE